MYYLCKSYRLPMAKPPRDDLVFNDLDEAIHKAKIIGNPTGYDVYEYVDGKEIKQVWDYWTTNIL